MEQRRARQYALAAALCLVGCSGGARQADPTTPPTTVRAGVDVLLARTDTAFRGKRIGLITNQTGVTADGTSSIDALYHHPGLKLVALFSPEHGIRGTARGGDSIANSRDEGTGLPIRSLYGATNAPTPDMLRDVDVLMFDIQDVGARYYTYVWTMALALRAAAAQHKTFVVLDRPDPIGGELMQGNVLDTAFATLVGLYPVPMRFGMTVGEIARWLNDQPGFGAQLEVIPMHGWRRKMWYDDTGLRWIVPSPNMPDLESATHYPGTCLFEGTNLSVGRGTPRAFQQIGAPWLAADELVRRLNARNIPGVRFEAVRFTPRNPGDGKYSSLTIPGVRFHTTDRQQYDPTVAAVAALVEIHALQPDSLTFRVAHFDRLSGTDRLRRLILAGASLEEIVRPWSAQLQAFEASRRHYLLYP